MDSDPLCEVCERAPAVTRDTIPGLGTPVSRCTTCTEAKAYPLPVVVSATAVMGGMFFAPDWWEEVVDDTCALLRITFEDYLGLVDDWGSLHLRRGVDYG